MSTTTRFDDVAIDDTTTYETIAAGWSYNFGTDVVANPQMTAICMLDSPVTLTAWRFTGTLGLTGPFSGGGSAVANSASYTLQYSADGTTGWTTLSTGTLGTGFIVSLQPFNVYNGTSSVTAKAVRLYLTYSFGFDFPGHSGSGNATIYLSDFRLTTTGGGGCTPPAPPTLKATSRIVGANYLTGLGGKATIRITN